MASPFHETPGKHHYGDIVYEWRSLLSTPCYGFNGPNACYSTTCTHNPIISEQQKQISKQILATSSKFCTKFNHNSRRTSGGGSDNITSKSSVAPQLTGQTNVFHPYGSYGDSEIKFNG